MRLDRDYDKPFDVDSGQQFIIEEERIRDEDLSRFKPEDRLRICAELSIISPKMYATYLKLNYKDTTITERINRMLNQISDEGMFTLVLGAKRYGKTASAFWVAEEMLARGSNIYWYGYYPELKKIYPEIRQILNLTKISNGLLIYDETLLTMQGRDFMLREIKERVKSLPTMGHRGISTMWLSQSMRIDPLIRDLLDYVWFKPFFNFELFKKTTDFNQMVKYLIPTHKNENLLINLQTQEPYKFENPLPLKWNEKISKPFSLIEKKEEAREYFEGLMNAGYSQREVAMMLRQRGWDLEDLVEAEDMQATESKPPVTNKTVKKRGIIACKFCGSMNYMLWSSKEGRYRCNDCMKTFRLKK